MSYALTKGKFAALKNARKAFKSDENGSLTIFTVMTGVIMVGLAGIAIDVARFEAERSKAQIAIDNAALAGASLNQAIDPSTITETSDGTTYTPDQIVDMYLAKADLSAGTTYDPITIHNSSNRREVAVNASLDIETVFMKMFGYKNMNLKTTTSAMEGNPLAEVSLVLDVSGSMRGTTKLGSLVTGAQTFVDSVLSSNTVDSPNLVSLSLIPYSTYVNAGANLIDAMGGNSAAAQSNMPNANSSTCLEFPTNVFSDAGEPTAFEYHTTFAYQNYSSYAQTGNSVQTPYCPSHSWAEITPHSNNATALKAQLGQFGAGGNTSIDDGVKWGAALLDPSMQGTITSLTQLPVGSAQRVDPGFDGRPYDDNMGAAKILVVMTDGHNTKQYRLKDYYESNAMSGIYYNASNGNFRKYNGSSYVQLSWRDYFSIRPVRDHLSEFGGSWSTYMEVYKNGSQKNDRLESICSAAKAKGIVIYTITYEASSSDAQIMEDCATSPSYAYTATSVDIASVFSNVTIGIKKLQLTN